MCERAPAALLHRSGRGTWRSPGVDRAARSVPARRPWTMMSGAEAAVVAPQTAEDRDGLRLLRRVGVVDPDVARRLPATQGTRRSGGRSSSVRGRDPRAQGLEASRARGRCVPRGRGGRRSRSTDPAPLLHLQRGRVRARHVQGSGADGARSVRVLESLTIAGYATASEKGSSTSAASTRCHREARARDRSGVRPRVPRPDVMGEGSRSTSSSGAAPGRTSAARRPRCSTRSRASAASLATSRRSRSSAACSASRPGSTTSRRS